MPTTFKVLLLLIIPITVQAHFGKTMLMAAIWTAKLVSIIAIAHTDQPHQRLQFTLPISRMPHQFDTIARNGLIGFTRTMTVTIPVQRFLSSHLKYLLSSSATKDVGFLTVYGSVLIQAWPSRKHQTSTLTTVSPWLMHIEQAVLIGPESRKDNLLMTPIISLLSMIGLTKKRAIRDRLGGSHLSSPIGANMSADGNWLRGSMGFILVTVNIGLWR